jgi:hypothetical protein
MNADIIGLIILGVIQLANTIILWRSKQDIRRLEQSTNGKMDQLLALTASSSEAAGELMGRVKERAEHDLHGRRP